MSLFMTKSPFKKRHKNVRKFKKFSENLNFNHKIIPKEFQDKTMVSDFFTFNQLCCSTS